LLTISRKGHVSWWLNNFQTATCDRYNRRQLIVYVSAMLLFVKSGNGVFKALDTSLCLLSTVDIDKLYQLWQTFITSPWQFCFNYLSPCKTGNMLFSQFFHGKVQISYWNMNQKIILKGSCLILSLITIM